LIIISCVFLFLAGSMGAFGKIVQFGTIKIWLGVLQMKKALIFVSLCLFIVACGGGGGGGGGGGTDNSGPSSDKLLGGFDFYYSAGGQNWYLKFNIDHKGTTQTSDGTDIYLGHVTTHPGLGAAGAWYPSLNKYVMSTDTYTATGGDRVSHACVFVIEADKRLTGCHYQTVNGNIGGCDTLNSAISIKSSRISAQSADSNAIDGMPLNARESSGAAQEENAGLQATIAGLQSVIGLTGN
jgi:hypothetical protein